MPLPLLQCVAACVLKNHRLECRKVLGGLAARYVLLSKRRKLRIALIY